MPRYPGIKGSRAQMLAELTLSPDAAYHVAARLPNIDPELASRYQEVGAELETLNQKRLDKAQSGESPIIPVVRSFDAASRVIAQTNWPLADRFEAIDANVMFDEEGYPTIAYMVEGAPLDEWLKKHGHGGDVAFITDTLNDSLLNALNAKDIVFEEGRLMRRNEVIGADDFKGYTDYLSKHAFEAVAKKSRIITHALDPNQSSKIVQEAEQINQNFGK